MGKTTQQLSINLSSLRQEKPNLSGSEAARQAILTSIRSEFRGPSSCWFLARPYMTRTFSQKLVTSVENFFSDNSTVAFDPEVQTQMLLKLIEKLPLSCQGAKLARQYDIATVQRGINPQTSVYMGLIAADDYRQALSTACVSAISEGRDLNESELKTLDDFHLAARQSAKAGASTLQTMRWTAYHLLIAENIGVDGRLDPLAFISGQHDLLVDSRPTVDDRLALEINLLINLAKEQADG